MATARIIVLIVATASFAIFCDVSGQVPAPAPGPSSDCLTTLLNMSDCLAYVQSGSNLTVPDKPCCPELAGMVENNPICLCEFLGQADSFGVNIDVNRALKLPSSCDVVTPPTSLCTAVGVPVPSPPGPGTAKRNEATTISGILPALAFAFGLELVLLS